MMKLSAEKLDLHLRHTFTIARSSSDIAQNVLVRIKFENHEGLGEAAPLKYYGQSQASCIKAIKKMAHYVEGHSPFDLDAILTELQKRFPDQPSAIAAIDIALHDLIGKITGLPLWKYWGLNPSHTPQTSFTIGIDTLKKVVAKLDEAHVYPVLKIKLGVENDMEIMREVRKLCPKKTLRVDANCGWTVKQTIEKAKVLEKLGVEFIEQPIPPGNNAALKKIRNKIGLELITDESSLVPADIPPLVGCVHGINIKLVKCGGLSEGLKMIYTARACGLKIMIGCMIESSVLISAAAQLTPLVDYADLDGNLLISNDPFQGVTLDKKARLLLSEKAGLGVTVTKPVE